ncbi:MAG: ABC transporter permease [Actinobacteria bacterium]|nr:ABC transporter permease [Actinomycetota bacterium]
MITPAFFLLLLIGLVYAWTTTEFDPTTARILGFEGLVDKFGEHLFITFWSTVFVVGIAIPLGIALTRPRLRGIAPLVVTFASSGQAIPAYGLIVLFLVLLGQGTRTAIAALTVFALIPVLRNTMVGLDQVDKPTIEAARGMGLSKWQVLRQIELPLAVPVILAGVRTALIINVGMAALVFLIGGGALGETINSALKLNRPVAVFIGGALVALLALAIDFIAALAERYLRPKGI